MPSLRLETSPRAIHRLTGRSAVVTGSSGGIGRAIALRLGAEGAVVTVNHRRSASRDDALEVVRAIEAGGGRAQAVQADALDPAQLADLIACADAFGEGLDIVVGNAAGETLFKPISQFTLAEWEQITIAPQRAVFELLRQSALRIRDGGRIIVLTSSVTADPYPGTGGYAGVKAAAELYVRVLAREIGGRGVTVNAVAPGLTDTAGMRAVVPAPRLEATLARTPLGRLGRPEDIADAVGFLASPEGGWITGQVIRAGGGIV